MQYLQPGTTLQGGKYRIERVLGQGGFGITYLARNTVLDIDVAIKEFFMKDENNRDGSFVTTPNITKLELFHGQMEKFKKEAKRMFAIKNEHIIGVQDRFEENGTAYYVMDYVDGENLAERLERTSNPMTEHEVREILPQILDALNIVHKEGLCHLDIKPSNIMLAKGNKVRVIDFGASKQLGTNGTLTTNAPTAFAQTPGYAPREQMEQNFEKIGPWTDIYALGATLYTLLTNNRPPMPSDIDDDISVDKHYALPFPASISAEMKQLVLKMLKTNRMQRPQNIESVVALMEKHNLELEKEDEATILSPSGNLSDEENVFIHTNPFSPNKPNTAPNPPYPNGTKSKARKYIIIGVVGLVFLLLFGNSGIMPSSCSSISTEIESSDPVQQNKIGNMYATGKGREKNMHKAAYYYRLAAEQGNKYAQNNLGFCYWDGKGVAKDRDEAIKWLRRSAEQGYKPAKKFLRNNGLE